MTNVIDLIEQIRASSRTMVRELGFMNSTLAATTYNASAVHALLEIEQNKALTSAQLVESLGLEKSSISRLIQKLIKNGEITELPNPEDGRVKKLLLTSKGKELVNHIHLFGQQQVSSALKQLALKQQQTVADGITLYADALKDYRLGLKPSVNQSIEILEGYRPGIIGRVTQIHAEFYFEHAGFGAYFEKQIATGLSEFIDRLNKPCNKIWLAVQNGHIVGSIAIDGQDLDNNHAHLRWFILDQECRGMGVGKLLLSKALAFCQTQQFDAVELWTFKGLNAAIKLYEQSKFQLEKEEKGSQWGTPVIEQHFIKKLIY